MEAVQLASIAVERETEEDVAAIRERLESVTRQKMALLQVVHCGVWLCMVVYGRCISQDVPQTTGAACGGPCGR